MKAGLEKLLSHFVPREFPEVKKLHISGNEHDGFVIYVYVPSEILLHDKVILRRDIKRYCLHMSRMIGFEPVKHIVSIVMRDVEN